MSKWLLMYWKTWWQHWYPWRFYHKTQTYSANLARNPNNMGESAVLCVQKRLLPEFSCKMSWFKLVYLIMWSVSADVAPHWRGYNSSHKQNYKICTTPEYYKSTGQENSTGKMTRSRKVFPLRFEQKANDHVFSTRNLKQEPVASASLFNRPFLSSRLPENCDSRTAGYTYHRRYAPSQADSSVAQRGNSTIFGLPSSLSLEAAPMHF